MTSAAKPDYAARLKEIRERCDAATPGPWRVRMWGGTNRETPEPPEWTIDGPDGIPIEAHDVYPGNGRDVYFMGHARSDVPFLLSVIDDLAKIKARAEEIDRDTEFWNNDPREIMDYILRDKCKCCLEGEGDD